MRAAARRAAVHDACVTTLRRGSPVAEEYCVPEHFQKLRLRQPHSPELHQGIAVVGEPHGFLSGRRLKMASLRAMGSSQDSLADVRLLFVVSHSLAVAPDVHSSADARYSALAAAGPHALVAARTAKLHFAFQTVAGWGDWNAAAVAYNAAAIAACANKTVAAASMSAIHTSAAIHTTGAAHSCSSDGHFPAWTGFVRSFAAADCADQNFAGIHAGSADSDYGVEQTTARPASASMPLPSYSKCTCSSPLLPDILL